MRDFISVFINGEHHQIRGEEAFMTLSDYLRYQKGLVGTKVVCAEGDCGACTVIVGNIHKLKENNFEYVSVNSCIAAMHILDGSHIVTVEGLKDDDELNAVQESMVRNHGAQCGFCTPGFICSMNAGIEAHLRDKKELTERRVKNTLTGNLCRCTGYKSIIEAGLDVDLKKFEPLTTKFDSTAIFKTLKKDTSIEAHIKTSENEVFFPTSLESAIDKKKRGNSVFISGGSDLGVLYNKRGYNPESLIGLHNVKEMNEIIKNTNDVFIGARVNLHQIEDELRDEFYDFTHMIHIFASPQIKNRATLVGNVANASPIGDSIPFLMVVDAMVVLIGPNGEREVNINDFYLGYKQLDMKEDEFIKGIRIPYIKKDEKIKLYKASNRKDMDISIVTFAAKYKLEDGFFKEISLAVGGVGPIVMRVKSTEAQILGKKLDKSTFEKAAEILKQEVTPIDDVRGSANFRRILSKNLLLKLYAEESLGISKEMV